MPVDGRLRQRGITVIELFVVFAAAALAAALIACVFKIYGPIGIAVVLAGAVGILATVFYVRRSSFFSGFALMLLPFLVIGVYILWPGVFPLRLAAVAAVLTVGDFLSQGMYVWIVSRGTAEEFTFHFGQFLFVVVMGTTLSIWWGWSSTAIVLLVDGAWQALAGLADRKTLDSFPPDEE